MSCKTALAIVAVLFGVSPSQLVLAADLPPPSLVEVELGIGGISIVNQARVIRSVTVDGMPLAPHLTTPVAVKQSIDFEFDLFSERAIESVFGPGIGNLFDALIAVRTFGAPPVGLGIDFFALPGATGTDANASIQLQQTCASLCTSIPYSARIFPDDFEIDFNHFRLLAGNQPSTLRPFSTFQYSADTVYGAKAFSVETSTVDLASPGGGVGSQVMLEQFGVLYLGLNASTQATLSSTASASGWVRITVLSAVPEPEAHAMLLAGLGLVAWVRQRKTWGHRK